MVYGPEQIKIMQAAKKPGVIINLGSSAGLYPMVIDPIYSGSKGLFVFEVFSLNLQKCLTCKYVVNSFFSSSHNKVVRPFGLSGGVVMFTRSLAPLKRQGIRINVLCPEVSLLY